jgi:translation initiation factor eIF-2B subunit delta
MSIEAEGSAPTSQAPEKQEAKAEKKDQSKPQQPPKDGQQQQAAPAGEKKLSGAELKKRAKEEKAARRAQAKVAQVPQGPAQGDKQAGSDGKGGKAKPKQDGQNQQHGGAKLPIRSAGTTVVKDDKPSIPDCFSHLSMARRIDMTHADKDVHPAVLVLGEHMSAFAISDSITRLEATLYAFKKVIDSYSTPPGSTFSRHFTSHVLNPQIEYLTACRPMCFSMGNAVRWLKLQISKIDIDLPDSDAKKLLSESIDNYIRERITLADYVIVETAANMIDEDDVVLTYAHHHLVERTLLQARQLQKKNFRVILVDDPYERVSIDLAKRLSAAGIHVAYSSDLSALRTHLSEATQVLLAAEAIFSNGAMYARAGSCDIATVATDLGVRVVALCETINFTERVSIDSLTYNEIDPERSTDVGFRLLFDTTRDKYITVVVTELGNSSATSVPAILRKLEEL